MTEGSNATTHADGTGTETTPTTAAHHPAPATHRPPQNDGQPPIHPITEEREKYEAAPSTSSRRLPTTAAAIAVAAVAGTAGFVAGRATSTRTRRRALGFTLRHAPAGLRLTRRAAKPAVRAVRTRRRLRRR